MQVKTALMLITFLTCTCFAVNPTQAASLDAWKTQTSMHTARSSLGAAQVNDEIYAIGGVIDPQTYVTCTGANEKYNPQTNMWTILRSMPTPRASFATAVVDDKIYCIGGTTGVMNGQVKVSGVNEVYNPKTDTWTAKTAMPTPRVGVTAGVVNGKIYLIGGDSNVTEVYDPATDTWTTKSPMPFKPDLRFIWSCTSTVLNDKIHVFGAKPYSVSHQVYDPTTDSWTVQTPIVQGYLLASATATSSPQGIWLFGVDSTWWDAGPPNFTSLTWDSTQACWRVSTMMKTPRVNSALVTVGDTVYAVGGSIVMIENNAHATALVEKYTPQKDMPIDKQAPEILVLSPQDKTSSTTVTVDFKINEPVYSIQLGVDEQYLVSVVGNTTITLQSGNHTITVYAIDHSGNIGASKTVHFDVTDRAETPLFWFILIGVGVSAFIIGAALVWAYFSHRKSSAD